MNHKRTDDLATESIEWLIDAVSSADLETSVEFLQLPPSVQLLTNHILRVVVVAMVQIAEVDEIDFLAGVSRLVRTAVGLDPYSSEYNG
jgi:hypothetical protein